MATYLMMAIEWNVFNEEVGWRRPRFADTIWGGNTVLSSILPCFPFSNCPCCDQWALRLVAIEPHEDESVMHKF
jgi:hypothetical protein